MATNVRRQRVADRIRAELSELLQRDVADPRLELVTITDVTVDRELAQANIFVSSAITAGAATVDERRRDVLAALHGASGYLRREVGHRVRLRNMPQLAFHWDPTPDRGEHMAQLLDALSTAGAGEAPTAPDTQPLEDQDRDLA